MSAEQPYFSSAPKAETNESQEQLEYHINKYSNPSSLPDEERSRLMLALNKIYNSPINEFPSEGGAVYTAETSDSIIGYAIIYDESSFSKGAYLSHIAVDPQAQRNGVATSLLKEMQADVSEISLYNFPDNSDLDEKMAELYARLGFEYQNNGSYHWKRP